MTTLTMYPVKSSQLLSVGYNAKTNTLYIEFQNWSVYEYYEVPSEVASAIISPSTSVGKYFYAEIKGKYDYKKIDAKVHDSMLKLT